MSDIVYELTTKLRADVTLAVTMGGGVVNLGKKMKVQPDDTMVLLWGEQVLGYARVLEVGSRSRGLIVAHGRVEPLTADLRKRVAVLGRKGKINARGGAYLP